MMGKPLCDKHFRVGAILSECGFVFFTCAFMFNHHKHRFMQKLGEIKDADFLFSWKHKCTPTQTHARTIRDRYMLLPGQPTTLELHVIHPPLPARSTKPHPGGQQQSKFQLEWKMPLIETKWVLMPFRLSGSGFGGFFGWWGETFLGQLFHYLPCAHSGAGSQLWPRLAGTTIIITISHQTAPARAWPREKLNVSLKLLLESWGAEKIGDGGRWGRCNLRVVGEPEVQTRI